MKQKKKKKKEGSKAKREQRIELLLFIEILRFA
jgi:hypothetical protein